MSKDINMDIRAKALLIFLPMAVQFSIAQNGKPRNCGPCIVVTLNLRVIQGKALFMWLGGISLII